MVWELFPHRSSAGSSSGNTSRTALNRCFPGVEDDEQQPPHQKICLKAENEEVFFVVALAARVLQC